MKAIILAAGLTTRLRPITATTPKCLVSIDGVLLLELWLPTCERAGVEAVPVNMHYLTERKEEFVEARRDMPVKLAYEPTLLGAPEPQRRIEILSARTSRFWWCMRTTSPPSRSPD